MSFILILITKELTTDEKSKYLLGHIGMAKFHVMYIQLKNLFIQKHNCYQI